MLCSSIYMNRHTPNTALHSSASTAPQCLHCTSSSHQGRMKGKAGMLHSKIKTFCTAR